MDVETCDCFSSGCGRLDIADSCMCLFSIPVIPAASFLVCSYMVRETLDVTCIERIVWIDRYNTLMPSRLWTLWSILEDRVLSHSSDLGFDIRQSLRKSLAIFVLSLSVRIGDHDSATRQLATRNLQIGRLTPVAPLALARVVTRTPRCPPYCSRLLQASIDPQGLFRQLTG